MVVHIRSKIKVNSSIHWKFDKYTVLFFLFLITPIMDTINGWYVLGHGETGVSIGTFYRLAILFNIFVCFKFNKEDWYIIVISTYFPISSALRAKFDGLAFMSAFTYGLKWMLPIIYILLYYHISKRNDLNIPLKVINIWKYLIPIILITEYLVGIGEAAYTDAGFKGYFYCTNDIGFSLTMLSIFSLYYFLVVKMNVRNFIPVLLNMGAIIILSTKSCMIFTMITIIYFLINKFKKSFVKFIPSLIVIFLAILVLMYKMQDSISGIINRYSYFYGQTAGKSMSFENIMGFLTSARTYRISDAITDLTTNFAFTKLLFGWRKPIFSGAIEMDWLDVLFQHGVIGLVILFFFYIGIIIKRKYKTPYQYMLIIAMICACFSGHVLNGALPSTVFSIIVGAAIYSMNFS